MQLQLLRCYCIGIVMQSVTSVCVLLKRPDCERIFYNHDLYMSVLAFDAVNLIGLLFELVEDYCDGFSLIKALRSKVIVVVLVFYGPSTLFRSFWARQLTYPSCSWASLLGSLPVLSAHSFASN